MARNSKETTRLVALIQFLSRQDRPQEALELCEPAIRTWRPETVAAAIQAIYQAASATEPQRRKVEDWLQGLIQRNPDNVSLEHETG